jgi:hypothetical protein
VGPGSEAYVLSEKLLENVTAGGKEIFCIPIISAILVSAWGKIDKNVQ